MPTNSGNCGYSPPNEWFRMSGCTFLLTQRRSHQKIPSLLQSAKGSSLHEAPIRPTMTRLCYQGSTDRLDETRNLRRCRLKPSPITPERMEVYRATARRRREEGLEAEKSRRELAWEVARSAAALLKEQFGAGRVMIFGSLAGNRSFSRWSDIDLAAWGLLPEDYFTAVARLQDLSPEFEVDLVAAEYCRPQLLKVILREGREL